MRAQPTTHCASFVLRLLVSASKCVWTPDTGCGPWRAGVQPGHQGMRHVVSAHTQASQKVANRRTRPQQGAGRASFTSRKTWATTKVKQDAPAQDLAWAIGLSPWPGPRPSAGVGGGASRSPGMLPLLQWDKGTNPPGVRVPGFTWEVAM